MTTPAIRRYSTHLRDLKWSPAEKAIARKVYESALKEELEAVVRETKQMAAKIKQVGDVFDADARRSGLHFFPQAHCDICPCAQFQTCS